MNQKTYKLMLEAIRRWLSFNHDRPLCGAWLGLGTKTTYLSALKDGLMEWVDLPPARGAAGWLKLTPKGEMTVKAMLRVKLCPDYDTPDLPNV